MVNYEVCEILMYFFIIISTIILYLEDNIFLKKDQYRDWTGTIMNADGTTNIYDYIIEFLGGGGNPIYWRIF
tara:strand:+ start:274 stop:489 length:216 start_codon:yes stop_codon:yes gene_type:complete